MKRSNFSMEFSEEDKEVPLFFGKKKKTAEENACCYFVSLTGYLNDVENPKRAKNFKKYHERMKEIIVGKNKYISITVALPQLSRNTYFVKGLLRMIVHATKLNLEEKKDIIIMMHDILKYDENGVHPALALLLNDKFNDAKNYLYEEMSRDQTMCSFCGNMLRVFSKYDALLTRLLSMECLEKLVTLIKDQKFELSSEAFETLKHLLVHKRMDTKNVVKSFILNNYDSFFQTYTSLMQYDANYMAQRTTLRTLYEILEDPTYEDVMIKFISDKESLKTIVNFLKSDDKQGLQYEAFLLLEVMIKNLSKNTNPEIRELIVKNKSRLLKFLKEFEYIESDGEYTINKEMMIHQLDLLN